MAQGNKIADGLNRLLQQVRAKRGRTMLDADFAPQVLKMMDMLIEIEPDVVRQQGILELMITTHSMRMGEKHARFVLHHLCRHATQLLEQFYVFDKEEKR